MIVEALQKIRAGALWSLDGESYDGLTWLDDVQTKPTESEINAAIPVVLAEQAANAYKRLRAAEYNLKSTGEQFAMQHDDAKFGTTTWVDWQDGIKAAIPKPPIAT